jgi:hypothetical protein
MKPGRRRAALACLIAQLLALSIPAMAAAAVPVRISPSLGYPGTAPADSARALVLAPAPSRPILGIVASGIGLAAGVGLAAWLKSEADDRYDEYLHLADPARAREARLSAQRYDRASLIGWGTAQLSFLALFYFLTREEERPLIPVEGEPIVRAGASGIEVGIRVAP